jgi:DNA polymerase-4
MTRVLALVWPDLRASDAAPELVTAFGPMLDALDDLSPRIEAVDAGVALVDVTGLGALFGTERRIAARAVALARDVGPLPVRCGIGDNRWLAALAARVARPEAPGAPAALHRFPLGADESREALRDLSLDLLPADPAARTRLALFGLTTMGQLADLPRSAVGAQFGATGERLQDLARGHDPRPLVPRRRPERLVARTAFEPPLDGVGAVTLALRRACAELCDRLRGRHLAPGRASLAIRLEDGPTLRVDQPFPQPALEPDWIARLLLSRLEAEARRRSARSLPNAHHMSVTNVSTLRPRPPAPANIGKSRRTDAPGARNAAESPRNAHHTSIWQERPPTEEHEDREEPRVAALTLTLDRLGDPATSQLAAFEARAGRWEELRWSLERIRHRFGAGRLWRAVAERPEAVLPEHRSRLVDVGQER